MKNNNYTVYSIVYNNRVIYIGYTSLGAHRWVCHKTKARNANEHSRPIHDFMRSHTENTKTFPEFSWKPICQTTDEDVAKELEAYYQSRYNLPKYNKVIEPDAIITTRPKSI
jgi:hypothetical protein